MNGWTPSYGTAATPRSRRPARGLQRQALKPLQSSLKVGRLDSAASAPGSAEVEVGAVGCIGAVIEKFYLVAGRGGLRRSQSRIGVTIAGRIVVNGPLIGRMTEARIGESPAAHLRPIRGTNRLPAIVDLGSSSRKRTAPVKAGRIVSNRVRCIDAAKVKPPFPAAQKPVDLDEVLSPALGAVVAEPRPQMNIRIRLDESFTVQIVTSGRIVSIGRPVDEQDGLRHAVLAGVILPATLCSLDFSVRPVIGKPVLGQRKDVRQARVHGGVPKIYKLAATVVGDVLVGDRILVGCRRASLVQSVRPLLEKIAEGFKARQFLERDAAERNGARLARDSISELVRFLPDCDLYGGSLTGTACIATSWLRKRRRGPKDL